MTLESGGEAAHTRHIVVRAHEGDIFGDPETDLARVASHGVPPPVGAREDAARQVEERSQAAIAAGRSCRSGCE